MHTPNLLDSGVNHVFLLLPAQHLTCRGDVTRWRHRREAYISALLIGMAVQAVVALAPCVAARLPPSKLSDTIWFVRLINAEAMAVMPVMFVVSYCLSNFPLSPSCMRGTE